MGRIRSLELLFNLEKKNLKSKEDCLVAALHCLFVNENLQCAGIGDEWSESNSTTELLPSDWNSNQNVYSLRYTSKDLKSRILLKVTKMEHILQVDAVMNEDACASMSVPTSNYISDDYSEYSSAYKDLDSLSQSFSQEIMKDLKPKEKKSSETKNSPTRPSPSGNVPSPPPRKPADLRQEREPPGYPRFPRVGGQDLDPLGGMGGGGGGMFMDPSSFGIPSRPTLPQFGVGIPGGLPRGAVPPGARFDPFMPPLHPSRFRTDPDHFKPPDFEDFM